MAMGVVLFEQKGPLTTAMTLWRSGFIVMKVFQVLEIVDDRMTSLRGHRFFLELKGGAPPDSSRTFVLYEKKADGAYVIAVGNVFDFLDLGDGLVELKIAGDTSNQVLYSQVISPRRRSDN